MRRRVPCRVIESLWEMRSNLQTVLRSIGRYHLAWARLCEQVARRERQTTIVAVGLPAAVRPSRRQVRCGCHRRSNIEHQNVAIAIWVAIV